MNNFEKKHQNKKTRTNTTTTTTTYIAHYFVLCILLFICSCGSDDPSVSQNITAQDIVESFGENPFDGDLITQIQTVGGQGTLSYSIVSQEPSGALALDAATGELVVANAKLFDFETNPLITAVIKINDSNESVNVIATIALNNLDDIEHILSLSKTAYIDADDGEWIQITKTEYNTLASELNNVSQVGTTQDEYNKVTDITGSSGFPNGVVYANVTSATIPINEYVFAFKYHAFSVSNKTDSKVKQSSVSIAESYADLGKTLPEHSGINEDLHFILKGSNSPTTDTGYLAFYNGKNASMGFIREGDFYAAAGDVEFLTKSPAKARLLYQGLSTTQKQW